MTTDHTTVRLQEERFQEGHEVFCEKMLEEAGTPFRDWEHEYLVEMETSYKEKAWRDARSHLQLDKWDEWRGSHPKRILESVRKASEKTTSENLVYVRDHQDDAIAPVKHVDDRDPEVVRTLADGLYGWFHGADEAPFPARFDNFAESLRRLQVRLLDHRREGGELEEEPKITCQGSWLAYLAFLQNRRRYFPIRTRYFEGLLHYYGNPELKLAGKLTFDRYSNVLALAELLRERLTPRYPEPTMLQVQSYMWVVAYQLEKRYDWSPPADLGAAVGLDREELFKRRCEAAYRRERRGLEGELFVLAQERERLLDAGRPELAERVEHVAARNDGSGYDVLSFTTDGRERQLEVKATSRTPHTEGGFFLTANERSVAQESARWSVYRVWNVDDEPTGREIGNVVTGAGAEGWQLEAATWKCVPGPHDGMRPVGDQ